MKQSKRSGTLVCYIFEETREGLEDCSFSVEVIIFNVVLFPFFLPKKMCPSVMDSSYKATCIYINSKD